MRLKEKRTFKRGGSSDQKPIEHKGKLTPVKKPVLSIESHKSQRRNKKRTKEKEGEDPELLKTKGAQRNRSLRKKKRNSRRRNSTVTRRTREGGPESAEKKKTKNTSNVRVSRLFSQKKRKMIRTYAPPNPPEAAGTKGNEKLTIRGGRGNTHGRGKSSRKTRSHEKKKNSRTWVTGKDGRGEVTVVVCTGGKDCSNERRKQTPSKKRPLKCS